MRTGEGSRSRQRRGVRAATSAHAYFNFAIDGAAICSNLHRRQLAIHLQLLIQFGVGPRHVLSNYLVHLEGPKLKIGLQNRSSKL